MTFFSVDWNGWSRKKTGYRRQREKKRNLSINPDFTGGRSKTE